MRIEGKVVKRRLAPGSKSDREAIQVVTSDGDYVLRRQGGNPYDDPKLESLVGKRVRLEGVLHGYTFLASDVAETGEDLQQG